MNYLLDANTFIEAKNRYYNMTFCPGYWGWIEQQFADGQVASVESVGEELLSGNDELKTWAASHKPLFLPVSDVQTQEAFAEIAQHAAELAAEMKPGALEEFLGGADPWLIAKARTQAAVVVTHEQFNPNVKKKILIPNVCRQFEVRWINTFDLLLALEARFVLEGQFRSTRAQSSCL